MARDDDATLAIPMLIDIVRAAMANGPPFRLESRGDFWAAGLDGWHSSSYAHIFAHFHGRRQAKIRK
jgi:hypothetical protein